MSEAPEYIPVARLLSLEGKTAIVTGGATGIGRGIVRRLAEAGANVVIADLRGEAARHVASKESQAGRRVIGVECDVAEEESVRGALRAALNAFGRVDVLVNNAGIYPFRLALKMSAEEWDRVQRVNLRGTFLFCREFANQVIQQGSGGVIVNVGSIDSFHPTALGMAAYDASKGGVWMFTQNFALEVASKGIRVNMVAPGGVKTWGLAEDVVGMSPEQVEAMHREFVTRVPLGRWGVPDDIATVVLFLASPASAYMTGAAVVVDGGRLLT